MESLPESDVLDFHPDTLKDVRKLFGFEKPQDMNKAIDLLENWVTTQKHFSKKDFTREYLEIAIIFGKGSVERAKECIDRLCTFKTLMPQYFGHYDIREDFKDIADIIQCVHLPNLTQNNRRVFALKIVGKKFQSTLCLNGIRWLFMMTEYLRAHEYTDGLVLLIDLMEVDLMELAKKLNVFQIQQAFIILTQGYCLRIKGVHVLSSSKLVDIVVAIFKRAISDKIAKRIQVYTTIEEVHQVITPVDILPMEYGGKEKSMKALSDKWIDLLNSKQMKEYLVKMSQANTDESYRKVDTFNDQYMGMPGSFRALTVD